MKISSIHVNSFRSLCEFDLSLSALTVLIGRNDAGKSNVLRAIQLLLDLRAASQVGLYDWSRVAKKGHYPRKIEITANLDGRHPLVIKREIDIDVIEETAPRKSNEKRVALKKAVATSALYIVAKSNQRLITDEEEHLIPSFYYLRPRTGALQEAFDPRKENNTLTLIKDWMPQELKTESALDRLMRKYARAYAPATTTLKAYAEFFEKEVLGALATAFTPDFPLSLNVDYRSEGRGLLFVRELQYARAKKAFNRLPLDHHGSGFITVVAMVFSIAVLQEYHRQLNKPLVIAVEEPEVHLHANAQRTFLSYLKEVSKDHQVIITTHSPIFVDRAEPENVTVLRRVTKINTARGNNDESKAGVTLPIADSHKENWKEIINSLGIHLSDALMAGEVNLLVEGATEMTLLPAMAGSLAANNQPSLNFDRVLVVSGNGGATPYMAKLLESTGNPTVIIVDNDRGGKDILKGLESLSCRIEIFPMPKIANLGAPLNKLKECEFEDLLDSQVLLDAFNEAFTGIPGFEFLPLDYRDFTRERRNRIGRGEPFGWIDTVGSLIGQKTTSANLINKRVSERVDKFILAKTAAKYVRTGKLAVPPFCQQLFIRINELLRT
jgi:predicted ATP-dependent endonuclease of OLD family